MERGFERGDGFEAGREGRVGQVTRVAAVAGHRGLLCGIVPPQADRMTGAGELDRERGAPRARADHGQRRVGGTRHPVSC